MSAKPSIFANAVDSLLNLCGLAWVIMCASCIWHGDLAYGALYLLVALSIWREIDMREIKRKLDHIAKLME